VSSIVKHPEAVPALIRPQSTLRRHGACETLRKFASCGAHALVAALLIAALGSFTAVSAQPATAPAATPASSEAGHGAQPAPAHGTEPVEAHPSVAAASHERAASHEGTASHEESPWALIARIVNFLILAGGLGYFLRGPIIQHLAARRQQITGDLTSARETTERARQQLVELDRRAKELPAELEELKARGAEEAAEEGVRIRQLAEAERHRLLEQARREIELQVRLAKQSLAEHTADLAVKLASDRIAATITADDQARLIDRYVSDVKELHG